MSHDTINKFLILCSFLFSAALQNNELSPIEVLQTFQWKALCAQEATNCICEFVSDATAWASELERKFKNSSDKPPLYGIPVSIKECNYVSAAALRTSVK